MSDRKQLTNGELIELLQKLPTDLPVVLDGDRWWACSGTELYVNHNGERDFLLLEGCYNENGWLLNGYYRDGA